jgi:hypothetical protein
MLTPKTAQNVDMAIHGLMYVADEIDKALLGGKRHLNAQQAERSGPFAQALGRLAEIADGAAPSDRDEARADLQLCFPMLRHLQGGFYSACWDVLSRAHEALADFITEQEAEELLDTHKYWLKLDATLGHIHLFELKEDGKFHAYDATILGRPLDEFRYDRSEIEARKRLYDGMTIGKDL